MEREVTTLSKWNGVTKGVLSSTECKMGAFISIPGIFILIFLSAVAVASKESAIS